MKILITGASGYVGASIYENLKNIFEVTGMYFHTQLFPELEFMDVRNTENVLAVIQKTQPNVIIHVAANPSAPWCEKNPEEAILLNVVGTQNIVDAANATGAQVVFISSLATANTQTVYGKSKIQGEEIVRTAKAGWIILRPSLILGLSPNTTNDRTFNRILKHIQDGALVTYDTSWKFQPTWLKHISEVIVHLIDGNITNESISICTTEVTNRFETIHDLLTDFGVTVLPEDKKDTAVFVNDPLEKLKELDMPMYTYSEMISGIKEELRKYQAALHNNN